MSAWSSSSSHLPQAGRDTNLRTGASRVLLRARVRLVQERKRRRRHGSRRPQMVPLYAQATRVFVRILSSAAHNYAKQLWMFGTLATWRALGSLPVVCTRRSAL